MTRLPRLARATLLAAATAAPAAQCGVATTGLAFGSYDPLSASPLDVAGDIEVSCDGAVPYSIALSAGSGSHAQRTMMGGGHTLDYNLYTEAARLIVWGNGSGSTATVSGNASSARHTVYGRVPERQQAPAGSYADNVTVTLSF